MPSMMLAPRALAPIAFGVLSALLGTTRDTPPRAQDSAGARGAVAAASCTLCHPGERASFERSVHAKLELDAIGDASCLKCHENGLAHQGNAKSKLAEHAPGRGNASCVKCHGELDTSRLSDQQIYRSSHPSKRDAKRALAELRALIAPPAAPDLTPDERSSSLRLADGDEDAAFRVEGLIRAGLRLVDVDGQERLFDKDWNLDAGARLTSLEFRALRGERELFEVDGGGVEDRSFWIQGSTGPGLIDGASADGGYRRTRWVYEGDDDWATLSSKRDRGDARIVFETGDLELELGWERDALDGRTLAASIGNPDATPLVPARGLPVDRRFVSDRIFVAAELPIGATKRPAAEGREDGDDAPISGAVAVEIGWEAMRQRDELRYTRPSSVAPGFNESEVSSSQASRRGFDGSIRLAVGESGGRELRAVLFALDHDVRVSEAGELVSFDTSSFRVDSLGNGRGSRRMLSGELQLAEPVWSGARALVDASWRDQRDLLGLELFETTTRPPNRTVARSVTGSRVRNTEREFRLGLEQTLFDGDLILEAAYRYLEQDLEVPDLATNDADFRAGKIRTDGPELAADWRPADNWRVRGVFRWAGTDDVLPNETQPEVGHFAKLRIRRRTETMSLSLWAKWRRGENDVASTELDNQSYGVSASLSPWDKAQLQASFGFSRVRSETLTNFYFAPSLTPVPRFVRYRGDSVQADVLLDTELTSALRSTTMLGLTHTDGSLDTIFWRADQDFRLRLDEAWSVGVRGSFFEYEGDTVPGQREGYDARLAFLYAEFRF